MASPIQSLVDQLKAVSHPLRLRTLALLDAGELCVCQVAETLAVPRSSVSEALRELRRAGFVTERREGRRIYVSVVRDPQASPLLEGILAEAAPLPEVHRDRVRGLEVQSLALPVVCARVQGAARG